MCTYITSMVSCDCHLSLYWSIFKNTLFWLSQKLTVILEKKIVCLLRSSVLEKYKSSNVDVSIRETNFIFHSLWYALCCHCWLVCESLAQLLAKVSSAKNKKKKTKERNTTNPWREEMKWRKKNFTLFKCNTCPMRDSSMLLQTHTERTAKQQILREREREREKNKEEPKTH